MARPRNPSEKELRAADERGDAEAAFEPGTLLAGRGDTPGRQGGVQPQPHNRAATVYNPSNP